MIGTPVTLAELVAVILGTLPTMSVGLLTTPDGAVEAWVTTDDVEFDRAGDEGRALTNDAAGGGDGAANELVEPRCWCWLPPDGKGEGGANTEVGVGTGVFWLEETAVSPATGRLRLGTSPV